MLGVCAVARKGGDADAACDDQGMSVDIGGLGGRGANFFDDGADDLGVFGLIEKHDDEFVAAEARHRVGWRARF